MADMTWLDEDATERYRFSIEPFVTECEVIAMTAAAGNWWALYLGYFGDDPNIEPLQLYPVAVWATLRDKRGRVFVTGLTAGPGSRLEFVTPNGPQLSVGEPDDFMGYERGDPEDIIDANHARGLEWAKHARERLTREEQP